MARLLGIAALLVGLLAPGRALAQQEDPPRPFTFNLGVGPSFPLGKASDRINVGPSVQVGGAWNIAERVGLQLEYFFSGYDVDGTVLTKNDLDGSHRMQYLALNGIFTAPPKSRFAGYLIGGPGVYFRQIQLTRFRGQATLPFCDPVLLVCSSTPVDVQQILGTVNETDFGLNGGAGLIFRLNSIVQFYLEARYHYVWGKTFTGPNGREVDTNTAYLPVSAGVRL